MAEAMRQISLVGELEVDIEIKGSAKKFHQMLAGRPQDIVKVTPDNIQGIDLLEGEFGKVGGVILWNYVIDGQPRVSKVRIEAMDPEKNLIVLKVIEGDQLKEFKSFLTTIQATQNQRGPGSVVKCNLQYERIDDKVGHPEKELAVVVKMSKDMDEMLSSVV